MGKSAELDSSWLNRCGRPHRHLNSGSIHDRRCFVIVVRIVMGVEGSVVIVVGRDHVMIIVMMIRHVVSMRIDDHMVLVPRMSMIMTVMMMLCEYGSDTEHSTDRQHGKHKSGFHLLTPEI